MIEELWEGEVNRMRSSTLGFTRLERRLAEGLEVVFVFTFYLYVPTNMPWCTHGSLFSPSTILESFDDCWASQQASVPTKPSPGFFFLYYY